MSGRIVTEKYINDLGGRYLSSTSYHLELIVLNSDFIQELGSDRVYCPTFAERSSINSSYASVYTLSGGTFHLLSGLYVYVPTRVYSGQSGTLYSIASGDFVPEATITFNMLGADRTCATKLDAINAGCSVSGLGSYTSNLLIPTASVVGPGKATVSYNGYYVNADEVVASTKYVPSYSTRGEFGAYETEFPDPDDQTETGCNQVYTHVIGTTCTITKVPQPDEDIVAVDILQVDIVSNSSGKVLASGALPFSFTLTENCWVRIHALSYTLTAQPPTFQYPEDSDAITLADLNFGKVYLVSGSESTSGQLLFQKSSGNGQLGAASINNTLLDKYIYFYADSYLALATTPVLLDEAGKARTLVLVNSKESSPDAPPTQMQLFASVHEYWFSFPEDLPLDRSYKVVWSLKDCRTVLVVEEFELEQFDRVLTIINNGVGPVTVNGVTYTQPIAYTDETRVTIKWPEYKRVTYAEVDIMYRTDTYTVTDSISLSVRMSKTTVTLTPKPVICEYTTVTLTALSPGNTWESGVSIKSNLWNNSRSLYEIEGSTTNVATANTLSIFTNNKYVTSVSCFSSKNSGTYSVPNNCFNGCVGLQSALFDIPTYIAYGQNTFLDCTALNTVSLTDNVKSFGVSCFESSGIKTFVCPPLITAIPTKMAHACLRLHTVNLTPATNLSTIGERAFSSLKVADSSLVNVVSSLIKVQIPASVQSIDNYAFAGNYLLDTIMTSPALIVVSGTNKFIFNVDSSLKNNMSRINQGVFSYCTGLRHVLLPSSINTLETESFDSCDNIAYFNSPGLKVVMNDAFKNTWLEGMESKNLELVHETTNGYYGKSLYRKPYTTGIFFDTISADLGGVESNHTMCTYISPKTDDSVLILYKCNTKQKGGTGTGRYLYPIHKNTISISPYAFSGNYDFGNIGCYYDNTESPVNGKLEYIGYAAFYDNARIMAFRFPKNGVTSYLGPYAFCGCNNLSEVYNFKLLPITRLENYTFWGCGSNKYGIGGSTDAGYNNCDFYIPDTVTSIGKYAFAKCPQLMCIANLSTCNITSIEEGAFEGCFLNATWKAAVGKAVTLFTVYTAASLACAIYGGLESILRPVWLYSYLLGKWITAYVLERSIEWGAVAVAGAAGTIGAGSGFAASDFKTWHERRTQTAEVCLPKVKSLGPNVFKDCTHLGSIILNKNLTGIPKLAFASCTRLHDVNFVEDSFNIKSTSQSGFVHPNITTIGEEAFLNCKNLTENCIEHLLFSIVTIKKNAFKGCEIGRSIVIPKTLNVLEEGALGFKGDCTCIFLSKTPPSSVSSNVFSGTGTKTIAVRQGCKSAYLAKFPKASIHELSDDNELFVEYLKYGYEL